MNQWENSTLVLNRSWEAVNTCSAHRAIKLVYKERARIVDPDPWADSDRTQYSTYNLFEWAERGIFPSKPTFHLSGQYIQVPTIVVLSEFSKPPSQVVKYCRRNLWVRDQYRCQYCGKRPAKDDLTIDHVVPRSKGGISSFENTVLACTDCNRKKNNRTPEEANMRLRKYVKNNQGIYTMVFYDRPKRPRWTPLYTLKRLDYHADWAKFVQHVYWEIELQP